MNTSLLSLEIAVVGLGIGILLVDLWTPESLKRSLGYVAVFGLALIFCGSFLMAGAPAREAFGGVYILDGLALFFKRFFLLAGLLVLVLSIDYAPRFEGGAAEFYALTLFAMSGMMFAASANDFPMLFVSLELITATFYILNSFHRRQLPSLEAGVKYLIIGALSTAFLIYGIALVYGSSGTMDFEALSHVAGTLKSQPAFLLGLLLVLMGLGFKLAAFPFQLWAPDVYQGSPAPATAFLAVGSKAAGIVLLLRLLDSVVLDVARQWVHLLMGLSAVTILYGSLCAIPQRNVKRLLGYSSIANAGYLLFGIAVLTRSGTEAVLYYLGGYLFTVLAAFTVISLVSSQVAAEDIGNLAGLSQRSPLLAGSMTLAMVSLAGVPPLAGFIGKFLLIKAAADQAAHIPGFYWLIGVAIIGVVISMYYYFGVVRAIFWAKDPADLSPIVIRRPVRLLLYGCMAGMLYLGIFPGALVNIATHAVKSLPI